MQYYSKMTASERVEAVQFLREIGFQFVKGYKNAGRRKRLRRVVRVLEQT